MRPRQNPPPLFPTPAPSLASERRQRGRLRCDDLECSLGAVLDLSGSGMRVQRRGREVAKVGDEFPVRITYGEDSLLIHAKVVRAEKVGFRRHAYGLQFLHMDAETAARLARLATEVADRRCFV